MTQYNKGSTKQVIAFGGASSYQKETLQREWIQDVELVEFEGRKMFGPKYWHEYLEHFYGDYMTPPPEKDRWVGHSIVKVSFGDGLSGL